MDTDNVEMQHELENRDIKRIQEVLLRILNEFVRICDKYNLQYYPIDGTLLGLVRHKGFIPWDDDLDIAMPREDYDRFCEIAHRELPANMYWVSYEESLKGEYFGEIAHLFCKDMQLETDYFDGTRRTDIWMDVMIMYGMPSSVFKQKLHYKYAFFFRGLARMGRIKNIGKRNYSFIEKCLIRLAKTIDLSRILNTEKLLLHSTRILKKYSTRNASHVIVVPSEYGIRETVSKDCYVSKEKEEFQGIQINIPANADAILRNLYGNYMQLPPIEEQKSKHKVTIIS